MRSVSIPVPESAAAGVMGWLVRAQIASQLYGTPPETWLEKMGAPAMAVRLAQKSGVPGATSDGTASDAYGPDHVAVRNFYEFMAQRSAFFAIYSAGANGFMQLPARQRITAAMANATAYVRGEGHPVPLSGLNLESLLLVPQSIDAMTVVSESVLNDTGSAGQAFFNSLLASGVGRTVDEYFIDQMSDSDTETFSVSNPDSIGDVLGALRQALNVIAPTGTSRVYFIASGIAARMLATLAGDAGVAFPTLGLAGGMLFNRPLMVSDGALAGTLIVLDAGAIAANAGEIALRASRHASIEMQSAPANSAATATGANMVSMWQSNGVALLASAAIACAKLRSSAVAVVDGFEEGSL
jgi:hypothetical protein